jgi:hypothetical protein
MLVTGHKRLQNRSKVMNEIKDCRGVTINAGDTIVYPGRRGSNLWLSSGVVQTSGVDIPFGKSIMVRRSDTNRLVEIFETGRVAVVQLASGPAEYVPAR